VDIYHAWCDLKPDSSDIAFCEGVTKYLGHLKSEGLIESWRLTRANSLGPPTLGEFHLLIEVKGRPPSARRGLRTRGRPPRADRGFHLASIRLCRRVFALYRDFLILSATRGEEKF